MLALFLAFGTASFAQEPVRKLEFEAGLGYSLAITKEGHYGCLSALLELRYNLHNSPWNVGIHYENSIAPLESVDYEVLYDTSPGLGMSICQIENNTRGSFSLMPRAGVEFINHLRLTLNYKYNQRGMYHYLGLSIGGVFGGGRKRG